MKDYYIVDGEVAAWSLGNAEAGAEERGVSCLFSQTQLPGDVSLSVPTSMAPRAMEPPATLRATRAMDVDGMTVEFPGWLTATSQDDVATSMTFTPDLATELGATLRQACPDVACAVDEYNGNVNAFFVTRNRVEVLGAASVLINGKTNLPEDVAARFKVEGGVAFFAAGINVDGGPWVAASSPTLVLGRTESYRSSEDAEMTDDISKARAYVFYMRDALPAKSLAAVATAWWHARGRRVLWMDSASAQIWARLRSGSTRFNYGVAVNPLSAGSWPAGTSLENVEVGDLLFKSYSGSLSFAEGFTTPLLAWRREGVPWVTTAKVAEVQINGAATKGNYLDGGKPRAGLYFDSRPEPATSIDVARQLVALKWARRATFETTAKPPTNCLLPFIDGGTCNVVKTTATTRGWRCEAIAYAEAEVELLTPAALTFSVFGGSRAVTKPGAAATAEEMAPRVVEGYNVAPASLGGGCFTVEVAATAETRAGWLDGAAWRESVGGGRLGSFMGVALSAVPGFRRTVTFEVPERSGSAVVYRSPISPATGAAATFTFGYRGETFTVTQGYYRAAAYVKGPPNTTAVFMFRKDHSSNFREVSEPLGAAGVAKVCDLDVYRDDICFFATKTATDDLPSFEVRITYIGQNG